MNTIFLFLSMCSFAAAPKPADSVPAELLAKAKKEEAVCKTDSAALSAQIKAQREAFSPALKEPLIKKYEALPDRSVAGTEASSLMMDMPSPARFKAVNETNIWSMCLTYLLHIDMADLVFEKSRRTLRPRKSSESQNE